MRLIKDIESEIEKLQAEIKAAESVGRMMSNPGSAEFLQAFQTIRDSARDSMVTLDPHLPSLSIELAGHKRVYDTMQKIIRVLTGYEKVLGEHRTQLTALNGELGAAQEAKRRRERDRI